MEVIEVRTCRHMAFASSGLGALRITGTGASAARAALTASRFGSLIRRSHVLYHSHEAPQVAHVSRVRPPGFGSISMGEAS